MIGHLQRNKVKKAVKLFDMIETIDSVQLAQMVNKQCALGNKMMPVLIEINSGKESNKTGVLPEDARPYFKSTKKAFDRLKKLDIPNVEMKYLSMGMSNSYKIAIEEGANIIRIGTRLFGERKDN